MGTTFIQRKWVYPAIMILGFLLFFIAFARGGERPPVPLPDRPGDELHNPERLWRHSENDFIDSADDFNRNGSRYADHSNLETRLRTQEETIREIRGNWAASAYSEGEDGRQFGRMRNYNQDTRYSQERRNLDERRSAELREYREKRREIQNRMSGYNRQSTEYIALQRDLLDLDRRHAEEERRFEREFTNMDANYSQRSWR